MIGILVIVSLITFGGFLVAAGIAFLGFAHTYDNIAVRTQWMMLSSIFAAIGIAILGASLAIAVNVLYVILQEILSKVS